MYLLRMTRKTNGGDLRALGAVRSAFLAAGTTIVIGLATATVRADQVPVSVPAPPTAPVSGAAPVVAQPGPGPGGDTANVLGTNAPAPPPPAAAAPTQPTSPASPLPPPTDQPPPEVPLPAPLRLGNRVLVDGAVDMRYRWSDHGRSNSIWLNEAEVGVLSPIVVRGQTRANIVVQGMAENASDTDGQPDLAFGEVYGVYKLPLGAAAPSTAFVKVGQFQIPFGLLAVYDPHLDIVQPLYAQSLGIRTDSGVEVSGRFYSLLNYDFSMTTGRGADVVQSDITKVTTFRLGRTFYTRNGTVNVGGSLLSGTLPITDPNAEHPFALELPPSGIVTPDRGGFVSKSRIAADGTLLFKNLTARGEAMTGADNDQKVLGYFAEGEYRIGGRSDAFVARSYWSYPKGDATAGRTAGGVTYAASPNTTFRAVYEILTDTPRNQPSLERKRFTMQVLLRF